MSKASQSPIFLKGKKTNLRPIRKSDIPLFLRWFNDPEVRDFLGGNLPITEMQEEDWLDKHKDDKTNITLVIETKAGIPIGTMGIHFIDWKERVGVTGAAIGEKKFWNKGYGTDAKMTLLDYAFNTLNFHKICSDTIAYNQRSLRYSLHCGYKIEGRRKRHRFKRGRYWDLIELGLFRKDWLPIWEKYKATGKIR